MNLSVHHHKKEATFDLTPMIDVILLLIVFFTMTSQFSKSNRSAMDLPREKGEPAAAHAPNSMVIDVSRDGAISVEGTRYDVQWLAQALARAAKASPSGASGVDVTVRADRQCRTGSLDGVLAALKVAGISRWKLAASGEEGGR
ncbi:MAG: biopolymer transporter ExbD [Phycisphaerales bacterium]